MGITSLSHDCS